VNVSQRHAPYTV